MDRRGTPKKGVRSECLQQGLHPKTYRKAPSTETDEGWRISNDGNPTQKWHTIRYIRTVSECTRRMLAMYGIRVTRKPTKYREMMKPKDTLMDEEKLGVLCRLDCEECSSFYVGETFPGWFPGASQIVRLKTRARGIAFRSKSTKPQHWTSSLLPHIAAQSATRGQKNKAGCQAVVTAMYLVSIVIKWQQRLPKRQQQRARKGCLLSYTDLKSDRKSSVLIEKQDTEKSLAINYTNLSIDSFKKWLQPIWQRCYSSPVKNQRWRNTHLHRCSTYLQWPTYAKQLFSDSYLWSIFLPL